MKETAARSKNDGAEIIEQVQKLVDKLNKKKKDGGEENLVTQILRAKDERKELDAIKETLLSQIEDMHKILSIEQDVKIRGLFNRTSPLLSLPTGILENIVSYLDEEGLWAAESASLTLNEVVSNGNWECLDHTRPHGKVLDEELGCRTRGRAFGRMSFMSTMQEQHLADALSYQEEELTEYQNRWLYFFLQPEKLESYELVFLRLSHRNKLVHDRLVWQGFVQPTFLFDGNAEGTSLTEIVIEFHLQGNRIDTFREWIKKEMHKDDGKALLQKLELTILACNQLDAEPELVMTSRGFAHYTLQRTTNTDCGEWPDRDPMKYSQLQVNASFTLNSGTDDLFIRAYHSIQPSSLDRGSLFCVHF